MCAPKYFSEYRDAFLDASVLLHYPKTLASTCLCLFDILHQQNEVAQNACNVTPGLSLSSSFTHQHLGAFVATDPPIVCNRRLSCTSRLTPKPFDPVGLLKETRCRQIDGWFSVLFVKTLVRSYSCPITPGGPKKKKKKGWQRAFLTFLPQECSAFSLCCSGIWWHHHASYPGGRQTGFETHGLSPRGVFEVPQKLQEVSVRRSSQWCVALGMNLLMCVCCNGFWGLLSGRQAHLGFEVKTSFVNWTFVQPLPPGQLSINHSLVAITRLNRPVRVWVFSERWSTTASERCPPCKEFGG